MARCTVYVSGTMKCSGVLIARRRVLTNYHCVMRLGVPVAVEFGRGYLAQPIRMAVPLDNVIRHPQARYVASVDMYENDMALLKLPADAPADAQPVSLGTLEDLAVGDEVILAGYGGDRTRGMTLQPNITQGITRVAALDDGLPNTIRYRASDGATNAGCMGDSGGPMLKRRGDGTLVLVGIRWGADTRDESEICYNWGLDGDVRDYLGWLGSLR